MTFDWGSNFAILEGKYCEQLVVESLSSTSFPYADWYRVRFFFIQMGWWCWWGGWSGVWRFGKGISEALSHIDFEQGKKDSVELFGRECPSTLSLLEQKVIGILELFRDWTSFSRIVLQAIQNHYSLNLKNIDLNLKNIDLLVLQFSP